MSFNDLERGLNQPASRSGTLPRSANDAAFGSLQSSLSMQVFKINANVQGILKLVDQLGTGKDTGGVRKALHDLTETTREMVKRGTDDLKKLMTLQQPDLPQHKTQVQKTSHDLQLSLVAFQRAQKVSAERQRTVVDVVRRKVDDDEAGRARPSSPPAGTSPEQRLMQMQAPALAPADLAYQESIIQEREREIREIETGIHELNEIFRDLGTLVVEQGDMLDNIESNVSSSAQHTSAAAGELTQAAEYQRSAGRRACCLMIIMVIVVAIVLLAILS
ncbi:hypothetical protein BOTBODRAFT_35608 [Botryobasidium botryosum FD-172 SS1]|uniref:t-SNARE coiled-coil homology domain-containing protein n=1 Tax=Botryobasidium botryosum (strain FD-172 SS1) TaxID=930990 RepID=A0A067M678_BOTB1|nr:hypothetical protein BOTBODRAFT_35608 [Botryobasidium botryosum FD-172 SS1]